MLNIKNNGLILMDSSCDGAKRVAVVDSNNKLTELLLDLDQGVSSSFRHNIYLGTIVRIENSLQAAFVDYGGDKNGFLPFSEIHPDYYQISAKQAEESKKSANEKSECKNFSDFDESNEKEPSRVFTHLHSKYNIQDVIKKGQNVLIQVSKDSRGNKGVSLTTYISLAGRYCVFMPNSPTGIGVSRKIYDKQKRIDIGNIINEFKLEDGTGLVVRTAGEEASKDQLTRDYVYLVSLWNNIRKKALKSNVLSLIYSENNIIRQVIRDNYNSSIEKIVASSSIYDEVVKCVGDFLPNDNVKIVKYSSSKVSLFSKYKIEEEILKLTKDKVDLPSGGSIVINPTEALVAIDVNSGRSTEEKSVEGMALKTNLEAANEVARQLKLRNIGGLIVIDFIDMYQAKNRKTVETELYKTFASDKARIQISRISIFGLLECSRQRIRPSLIDAYTTFCPSCNGSGRVMKSSVAVDEIIHCLEFKAKSLKRKEIQIIVPESIRSLLENDNRLSALAEKYKFSFSLNLDNSLQIDNFKINEVINKQDKKIFKSIMIGSGYVVKKDPAKNNMEKNNRKLSISNKHGRRFSKRYRVMNNRTKKTGILRRIWNMLK